KSIAGRRRPVVVAGLLVLRSTLPAGGKWAAKAEFAGRALHCGGRRPSLRIGQALSFLPLENAHDPRRGGSIAFVSAAAEGFRRTARVDLILPQRFPGGHSGLFSSVLERSRTKDQAWGAQPQQKNARHIASVRSDAQAIRGYVRHSWDEGR